MEHTSRSKFITQNDNHILFSHAKSCIQNVCCLSLKNQRIWQPVAWSWG